MAKTKKTARIDLATEDMLLAEEDLAAMRPALAVAPELVVQILAGTQAPRQKQARKRSRRRLNLQPRRHGIVGEKSAEAFGKEESCERAGRIGGPVLAFGRAAELALFSAPAIARIAPNAPAYEAARGDDYVIAQDHCRRHPVLPLRSSARRPRRIIPRRPITLIVPFAAGGPTDIISRIVGEHM